MDHKIQDNYSGFLFYFVTTAIGLGTLYLIRKFIMVVKFRENVDAKGKVIIVTGPSTGIGKQIARELNIRGGKVYMMCRDVGRGNAAVSDLIAKYGCDKNRLIVLEGDLASFASVRKFVDEFNSREEKLDILVNNAGIAYHPKFEKTIDGHELTFQTNHLGHFLLTHLLIPKLKNASSPRIVNLSSSFHLRADNVNPETVESEEKFSRFIATYARSKLANLMHAVILTKKFREDESTAKITINACHPGAVNSDIVRSTPLGGPLIKKLGGRVVSLFFKSENDGAQTPVFLALSKKIDGVSGKYFSDCKQSRIHPLAKDDAACEALYRYSMAACGLDELNLVPSSAELLANVRQLLLNNSGSLPSGVLQEVSKLAVRVEELERERTAVIRAIGLRHYRSAAIVGYRMEEENSSNFLFYVVAVIIGASVIYLIRKFFKGAQFTEHVNAKGKVIIVTGASGGIGKQIVRELNIRGGKVYMMCRDVEKANAAVRDLAVKYGCDTTRLIVMYGDLTNFATIRKFVDEFNKKEDRLDILVNNAGLGYLPKFEKTVDGHEVTFQTNHLGHFLLTELLLPKLEKSDSPRIVNLSSLLHLHADNVNPETIETKEKFSRLTPTYARSKLANVMHAVGLTKKLRADDPTTKITINACHPGVVNSEFSRYTPFGGPIMKALGAPLMWLFMKTDYDGAQTPVFLALSKKVDGVSGKYFSECKESKVHPLAQDHNACETLYNYSKVACGLNK